jgi:hypothetical protein
MVIVKKINENESQRNTKPKGLQQTPGPTEQIGRFGDNDDPKVLLLVGHDDLPDGCRKFLVSESCLRTLGPRWRNLMSSRSPQMPWMHKWLFSKSPVTVNLWDEEATVIRIMMHIVHLKFLKVPETLDWTDIVNLTDFVARYDNPTLLAPYIDRWLTPYKERLLDQGYEEWLLVAHQFGYETEYLELAKYLSIHCRADPTGAHLLAPGFPFTLEGKFPVDALGMLAGLSSKAPSECLQAHECFLASNSSQLVAQ